MCINGKLQCIVCNGTPVFSDSSHLLTHLSSKGHLSQEFKLRVSSRRDDGDRKRLEDYQAWFTNNNLASLLDRRMRIKKSRDRRTSKARTEAVKGNIPRKRDADPLTSLDPDAPGTHTSMPQFFQTGADVENLFMGDAEETSGLSSAIQMSPLKKERLSPGFIEGGKRKTAGPAPGKEARPTHGDENGRLSCHITEPIAKISTPEAEFADACNFIPPFGDFDCFILGDVLGDLPLKGIIYPGMGRFDSATPDKQRGRNQPKNERFMEIMRLTSESIQPTEEIYSPGGSLAKRRPITGMPELDSPLKGESPMFKKRQSRTRRVTQQIFGEPAPPFPGSFGVLKARLRGLHDAAELVGHSQIDCQEDLVTDSGFNTREECVQRGRALEDTENQIRYLDSFLSYDCKLEPSVPTEDLASTFHQPIDYFGFPRDSHLRADSADACGFQNLNDLDLNKNLTGEAVGRYDHEGKADYDILGGLVPFQDTSGIVDTTDASRFFEDQEETNVDFNPDSSPGGDAECNENEDTDTANGRSHYFGGQSTQGSPYSPVSKSIFSSQVSMAHKHFRSTDTLTSVGSYSFSRPCGSDPLDQPFRGGSSLSTADNRAGGEELRTDVGVSTPTRSMRDSSCLGPFHSIQPSPNALLFNSTRSLSGFRTPSAPRTVSVENATVEPSYLLDDPPSPQNSGTRFYTPSLDSGDPFGNPSHPVFAFAAHHGQDEHAKDVQKGGLART